MVSVIEGAKALFSRNENKMNHLYLFLTAAVISIISSYFELHKNAGLLTILLAAAVYIALTVYIGGYTLKFMNNVYHNKESILPEFNAEPLKIFVNAIPFYVVWFVYTLIYILAAGLLSAATAVMLPLPLHLYLLQ